MEQVLFDLNHGLGPKSRASAVQVVELFSRDAVNDAASLSQDENISIDLETKRQSTVGFSFSLGSIVP